MNKLSTVGTLAVSALSAAFLVATGCGGGGASASAKSAARHYLGTQNPGDVWNWTLAGTTFTASNQTRGYTYSGTEATTASGFLQLTFTASTDPNVSVGSVGFGLEIPNTAIIIKPAGASTVTPVLGTALGGCPATTQNFTFVKVPSASYSLTGQPAYGTLTTNPGSCSLSDSITWYGLDGTNMGSGSGNFNCVNGTWTGTDNTGDWSPSGVFFTDGGTNNGGTIGVATPSSNVSPSDISSQNFRGFLISPQKTEPIAASPSGTPGVLNGVGYDTDEEVETNTPNSAAGGGVTVTFTGQPIPGLLTATVATSGGSESLVCAVTQVGGKYVMYSIGGSASQIYNLYLIQQ